MTELHNQYFNNRKEHSRYKNSQTTFVDIHCHCLPALDDGPETKYEALALCQLLINDGISVVIATPHQLGQFDGCNKAQEIREAVQTLNKELETHNMPLTIMPGGDIRLDERICQLLQMDKILTLADNGKYILLELPSGVFIDIEPLLIELAGIDIQVIISHPERHHILNTKYDILPQWLKHSAYLQITAGSLLGEFGNKAQKAAWEYLNLGWVSLVATDSHNLRSRRPRMKTAFRNICEKLGREIARLVCIENPLRVLEGQNITTAVFHERKESINAKRTPNIFR